MERLDRGALAAAAQDAWHYFVAASGSGDSTFFSDRTNNLHDRLQFLEDGMDKLSEIVDLVHEHLPRQLPHYHIRRREVRSEADLRKYARKGLKIVEGLSKRFKVDPVSGQML